MSFLSRATAQPPAGVTVFQFIQCALLPVAKNQKAAAATIRRGQAQPPRLRWFFGRTEVTATISSAQRLNVGNRLPALVGIERRHALRKTHQHFTRKSSPFDLNQNPGPLGPWLPVDLPFAHPTRQSPSAITVSGKHAFNSKERGPNARRCINRRPGR